MNKERTPVPFVIAYRQGLDNHDLGKSDAILMTVEALGSYEAERDFKVANPDTQFLAVWSPTERKRVGYTFGLGEHDLIMLKDVVPQDLVLSWRNTLPDGTLEEFVRHHINNDTFMRLDEHPGFLIRYPGW